MQYSYSIGNIGIKIICSEELNEKIGKYMDCREKTELLTIYITEIENEYDINLILDKFAKEEKGVLYSLEMIDYYCKNNFLYFAINNKFFGEIDLKRKTAKWFIWKHNNNSRAIFHICILDSLSLILPKHNMMVMHGSAILEKNNVILFLGHSGNGKSTISYKMVESNHFDRFCDDTIIVSYQNNWFNCYSVNSGYGFVKGDQTDILERYPKANILMETDKKIYFELDQSLKKEGILNKIFVLKRDVNQSHSSYTHIEKLSNYAALISIIDSQTNIGGGYFLSKYNLYKNICQHADVYMVRYNNDCDLKKYVR